MSKDKGRNFQCNYRCAKKPILKREGLKIFNKNMKAWLIIVIVLLIICFIVQCFNPNQSTSSGSSNSGSSNPYKGIRHYQQNEVP